jgi:hypothetical protein
MNGGQDALWLLQRSKSDQKRHLLTVLPGSVPAGDLREIQKQGVTPLHRAGTTVA